MFVSIMPHSFVIPECFTESTGEDKTFYPRISPMYADY